MELIVLPLVVILLLLLLSALFSAAETSITSVSNATIHKLKVSGNKKAEIIDSLKKNRENLIATILIANNALTIFSSTIAAGVALTLFGEEGLFFVTLIITFVVILFCEVLPKTYAIENSEKIALELAFFLKYAVIILKPITYIIQQSIAILYKILKINPRAGEYSLSAIEELQGTLDLHHIEGRVIREDKEMLGSVMNLALIDVGAVMVHRKNIFSVNIALSNEEVIEQVLKCGHTRIPLWENNPENIIAILHIKNLLNALRAHTNNISELNILNIAHKPWFVLENTDLKTQLAEFSIRRSHLAIVVDERGALEGLVTLNDIIEEIVGRISDEHAKVNDINIISEDICEVQGSAAIRDVNRAMDWHLNDSMANTIAGLLMHETSLIPEVNEQFEFYNTSFTILEKSGSQILKLRLEKVNSIS